VDALVQRRLLHRRGEGSFGFRHGLIQDAAYRAIPKALRAELHERYADVLDRTRPDDEIVGYHLEQAAHLCAELGRRDRRALRLAEDAGARLGNAGLRALKQTDVAAASNLLSRAAPLLPAADAFRREVLCELGVALGTAGEPDGADRAFADARTAAAAAGDRATALRAELEAAARRVLTDPQGAAATFLQLADEALPVLKAHGDERALGRLWMLAGWVHGGVLGRYGLWAEAAERALEHYRRAGFPSSSCVAQIASALYFGPTHVDEAVPRCGVLLDQADDLGGDASVRAYLAGLVAMRGRFELALDLLAESRNVFEDLGQVASVARVAGPIGAQVNLLAGDVDAAEEMLRESCRLLEGMRDRNPLATQAAELADLLYGRSRYDDAEGWVHVAQENAAADDVGAQCLWRLVAAKLRAREGATGTGEALAREAASLCDPTDNPDRRARVHGGLAEILMLDDRTEEAAREAEVALQLFEQKGNAVGAERLRVRLGEPTRA
jgi:tetratricopeptide (TPR) repeat protein